MVKRMAESRGERMSGGHWNYGQCNLGDDMFPGCDVCYGLGDDGKSKYGNYTESIKEARRANTLGQRLFILHSLSVIIKFIFIIL